MALGPPTSSGCARPARQPRRIPTESEASHQARSGRKKRGATGVGFTQLPKADLFDLLVSPFWSIFSKGPKRLTFYFQVFWATEFSFVWGRSSEHVSGSRIVFFCQRAGWLTCWVLQIASNRAWVPLKRHFWGGNFEDITLMEPVHLSKRRSVSSL